MLPLETTCQVCGHFYLFIFLFFYERIVVSYNQSKIAFLSECGLDINVKLLFISFFFFFFDMQWGLVGYFERELQQWVWEAEPKQGTQPKFCIYVCFFLSLFLFVSPFVLKKKLILIIKDHVKSLEGSHVVLILISKQPICCKLMS